MPELPEVETIVRGLQGLVGETIRTVEVRWPRIIAEPSVEAFISFAQGRTFTAVSRRAKFLVFELDQGVMIVHLRMTGQLCWRFDEQCMPDDKHMHLSLALDSGKALDYRDVRKFGRFWLVEDSAQVLGDLGPEPLDAGLDVAVFFDMLSTRKRMLKALLLDQHFIAGLGNIYVDESLWRASLNPARLGSSLTFAEADILLNAIRQVLLGAIAARGTTLQDYRDSEGRSGENQHRLVVYNQQGAPCPRCGTLIEKGLVAGRGTHYCPVCQPDA